MAKMGQIKRKQATNVSLSTALLMEAKQLKINLSALLESALVVEIAHRKQTLWLAEHQQQIQNYNDFIADAGLLADDEHLEGR